MMPFSVPGPKRQSILLIQGDSAQGLAVRAALDGWDDDEFQITWVRSCAAALDWLKGEGYRGATRDDGRVAIVVDLFQTDVQGIETFARLYQAAPRVPVLVIARRQDEGLARSAVQHGAQDYLLSERLDSHQLGKAVASMLQRAALADAEHHREEQARVTLDSMGDAVICSDLCGTITYLNGVAASLTGWTLAGASGHPVEEVLMLVDADTHKALRNPMAQALRENRIVALTSDCELQRRDGGQVFIETSSSPIRDPAGEVTGAVMVFHDVSAAREQSRQLSFLAQHDSLTDLPNRLLLQDRLTQAVSLAMRNPNRIVALLFVDLDGFKDINDSLGHSIGDLLLKSVSRRLLGCVRSTDTVCRQGGDEFVILLPELAQARDGAAIAEKVLRVLRAPHRILHHLVRITASIGVATLPDGNADAQLLLNNADLAMYHAKASGRNTYQYFDAALHARAPVQQIGTGRQQLSA